MSTENTTRGARKVRKGVVVSKSGAKTVKVRVSYREIHPVYGKVVTRNKNYHVHDEGRHRHNHGNASAQRNEALAHREVRSRSCFRNSPTS